MTTKLGNCNTPEVVAGRPADPHSVALRARVVILALGIFVRAGQVHLCSVREGRGQQLVPCGVGLRRGN